MSTNCGSLMSHDIAVRQVWPMQKADRGDLLMIILVAGRLPQTSDQSQLTQFIAVPTQ